MRKLYLLLFGFFIYSISSNAQIVSWQFGSPASTGDETSFNATTNNSNLTTSVLSRGSGVNAAGLVRGFSASNFTASGTKVDAITNNKYFTFSISAQAGYSVSLSTLDARLRRTSTGPNAYVWRYSIDGSTFNDIGSDVSFTSTVDGVDQAQINLSGISDLQNVTSGTTIIFRLYAWGASSTAGTFAIGRFGSGITTNSLAIGGTVSPNSSNSANSNIIYNSSFSPSTNINYSSFQSTDITDANSVEVGQFTIQDGGGAADADALGTTLTALSMSISNPANIRRVALYDGVTELGEVAGGATVSFSSLNLTAPDDGSKTYSVRVTYNSTVTDNQQNVFTITSATADVAGSIFAAGNAGGAASSSTGDDNRIEVTADRLAFVQQPTSPTGLNAAMAPAVTVSANDANGNRDLDFVSDVQITSTGTLSGSPVSVTAVAGLATFSTLTHTATGTGFTLNAERTTTTDWDVASNTFDISISSTASDYFRSKATGNWNDLTTWESSSDNSTWIDATLIPDNNANTITIRANHTVTVTATVTVDQLVVQADGILINQVPASNLLTMANGTGDDITIESSGEYRVLTTQSFANSFSASAGSTMRIKFGGVIRIGMGGTVGGGNNAYAVTAGTFIWETAASFVWNTTTTPGFNNATYFPDAAFGDYPVLLFSATPNDMGGGSNSIVNGLLVASSPIGFTGAGTKTFKGISNFATINASTSGKLILANSPGGSLNGTGSITLPAAGLDISNNIDVVASKTLNGNVNLLSNAVVNIFTGVDLTVTGTISGGSATSYIKTSGTGKLILNNVDATGKTFPVGNATYNPVTISNGDGLNWSVNVADAVNGVLAPYNTDKAVKRTWDITPSGTSTGATLVFQYDDSDPSQLGTSFSTTEDVQVWHYNGAWISASGAITPTGTAGGVRTVTLTGYTNFSPFAIANVSGPLPVRFTTLKATQKSNGIQIDWSNLTETGVANYSIERSTNGRSFTSLSTKTASKNDGGKADYQYLDVSATSGDFYYRIKATETSGKIIYSNIVRINTSKATTDLVIYPNPVKKGMNAGIQISSLPAGNYLIKVYDARGRELSTRSISHAGGALTETLSVTNLQTGIYHLQISGTVQLQKQFIVE